MINTQKNLVPTLGALFLGFLLQPISAETAQAHRIVSLNGSITEILFALGKGEQVVGADTSSYYPLATKHLPKVGYQRALSLEGILSLKPDLVVGTEEAGPPNTLEQLRKLGVRLEIIPGKPGLENTVSMIRRIGSLVGEETKSNNLAKTISTNVRKAQKYPPWTKTPTVLMIYSRGKGMVQVAGSATGGSEILALAGANNSITEFEGYKPLTPEMVFQKKNTAILITSMSLTALGGEQEFWLLPGFREIPIGNRPKLVVMDDLLLLGFSSRLDEAVVELQKKLN